MSFRIAIAISLLGLVLADYPLLWQNEFVELTPLEEIRSEVSRNEEHVYRLPENVVPLEYDIYIDLYFAERTDRPFSYDGFENIIVQAVEENVTQIVLHSNVDRINNVNLLSAAGSVFPLNPLEPYSLEPQYHFLIINLGQALTVNENYTLSVGYTSTMNEGPMKRGIWRGWYNDADNVERIYATTHFQPYNARQAFPCWDEPLFKSVFKIHLSRPSPYNSTFSNTGIETSVPAGVDRVQDNFYETPKMSSYLVTFLVSESFAVIAENRTFTPPIRIIGRSNTAGLGAHALELTVKMTEYFDEYFNIPYSTLHENLYNDHISSPDWASAGTENWGMVSYRELYLIIDPHETIMSIEHYATTLVAHELAHKWFGNLITCFWWSNTWINEGFASYFGYIAGNEMFPQYELHEHFNGRYLQASLAFDSGVGTVPMNHDVNTPAQVTGHFGTISYSKGAAFLRMTADMITLETFRKACQYFLTDNEFEPTDQYDLYNAFERAIEEDGSLDQYQHFNFTDYYRIWVNDPGYPILNVDINYNNGEMALQQERYFLSATATPTGHIYPIPLTYSTQSDPNFENVRPVYIMDTDRIVLQKDEGEEWVIFNNLQHGHYRVNYNTRNWDLISEALLSEPETIHYLNRAQIVDDVFAFMRSGQLTYNYGFQILRFLRHETNYHVWDAAITGYNWLRNRLRHIPSSQAIFDSFVLSYMEHAIESVWYDPIEGETPTISLLRQDLLHFACLLGHETCVQQSIIRFDSMKNSDSWVDPKIRRNVYVSGVRHGTSEDYDFIMQRYLESNYANDQLEMLRALGATRDSTMLTQYLDFTLSKFVRSHDKLTSFNYALLGNPENAYIALQWVMERIDDIREIYIEDAPPNPVHGVLSNLASYLDEPGLVEMEDWLRTTQTGTLQYNTAISAIASARANMAWGDNNVDIILGAARDGAATVVSSVVMMSVLAILAMIM